MAGVSGSRRYRCCRSVSRQGWPVTVFGRRQATTASIERPAAPRRAVSAGYRAPWACVANPEAEADPSRDDTHPASRSQGGGCGATSRASPLAVGLVRVTSGRAVLRVACRMFGGAGPAARPGCRDGPRAGGSDGEDSRWRKRSVSVFHPLPPTGSSRGGPGRVVLISGLPGLVISSRSPGFSRWLAYLWTRRSAQ